MSNSLQPHGLQQTQASRSFTISWSSLKFMSVLIRTLKQYASIYSLVLHAVVLYFNNFSQFSSVAQSCPTLCDPIDCSTPGFPVHHQLPKLIKLMTIESVMPSNHRILSSPSPPAFNLSQHQGLFQ